MIIEQEINKKIEEENKKEIKQENNKEIDEKEKYELFEKEKIELNKELAKDTILNIIWLDKNIYTHENIKKFNDLLHILEKNNYRYKSYKFERYLNIKEALNYIKTIKFEPTIIIIGGELYYNFINNFIKSLNDIYIIPKIVIYTKNKEYFTDNLISKNFSKILNDKFYNYEGIKTSFEEIKEFIIDNINEFSNFEKYKIKDIIKKNEKFLGGRDDYTFEYVDCKEKLLLPMFYKTIIETTPNDLNNDFMRNIYNNNQYESLKPILKSFIPIPNIPVQLLSKYYARIYTYESSFYRTLNEDLRNNDSRTYLPYIKTLYKGIELKSFSLGSDNTLYRASLLSKNEIDKIQSWIKQKKPDLPAALVFSKVFLSFSKERDKAERFLKDDSKIPKELRNAIFTIEKDNTLDYNLSTHADLEELSYIKSEKEVLFFPFSSFEIKNIEMKNNIYEIELVYLGKYLKEFKKDIHFLQFALNNKSLPHSKFKEEFSKSFFDIKEKIQTISNEKILKEYKKYRHNVKKGQMKEITKFRDIEPEIFEEIDKFKNQNNKEYNDSQISINTQQTKNEDESSLDSYIEGKEKCCKSLSKIAIISIIIGSLILVGIIILLILLLKKFKDNDNPMPIEPTDITDIISDNTTEYETEIILPSDSIIKSIIAPSIFLPPLSYKVPANPTKITRINQVLSKVNTGNNLINEIYDSKKKLYYKCKNNNNILQINSNLLNIEIKSTLNKNELNGLNISINGFDQNNELIYSFSIENINDLNKSLYNYDKDENNEGKDIILDLIPDNIKSIVIGINDYYKNDIIGIKKVFISIKEIYSTFEENEISYIKKELFKYNLKKIKNSYSVLFGIIERNDFGGWAFRFMGDSFPKSSIMQSYALTSILNGYIDNKDNKENFSKGKLLTPESFINIIDFNVRISLSWENYPKEIYDLDLSIVSFDKKNNKIEIINFKNLESKDRKIIHEGDDRIGMTNNENEFITLNLNMRKKINTLAVVVNSFKGNNFCGIKSALIRLYYNNKNIGYSYLEKETEESGLLFGFFRRNLKHNNYWNFHMKNYPLNGNEASQTISQIKEILNSN